MTFPSSGQPPNGWSARDRETDAGPDWPKIAGWTLVPVLLLVAWQIVAARLDRPWILPTATQVAARLVHPLSVHFASGSLLGNTVVSLLRVLIGFGLAACVGTTLGVVMGASRLVRGLVEPLVEILRPLCPIAWLPFAIAVFKLTTVPQLFGVRYSNTVFDQVQLGMIFILFWGAFFPILVNTVDGVAGVRRDYVSLAWTLGASRSQCLIHVYLPAAMPMIVTGLRQGIGTAWFVIIAAEMLPGSDSGIGYLLIYAADQSAMDIVIASMVIIGCIGALLSLGTRLLLRRSLSWHGKEG